jgi:hypothetical protein
LNRARSQQSHCGHWQQNQRMSQEIRMLVRGNKNRQCQYDHRYIDNEQQEEPTVPSWPSTTIDSRQCQSDHRRTTNYRSGSAIVATTGNGSGIKQVIRVLVRGNKSGQGTGPTMLRQQEWKCHCGHHTGCGRDMDSAIVAIQHHEQQEEPTELTKPSV